VFYGAYTAEEEVDGGAENGSRDTTMVDVLTLLDAFINISLRSACFNDEFFSGKKKDFQSSSTRLSLFPNYWMCECWITKILLCMGQWRYGCRQS
jgi:hypothetical protein